MTDTADIPDPPKYPPRPCTNISATNADPLGRTDVQITSSANRVVAGLDASGGLYIVPVTMEGTVTLSGDMSGPLLICDPACLKPRTWRRLHRLFMTMKATHM
jgi:hypothetical protein